MKIIDKKLIFILIIFLFYSCGGGNGGSEEKKNLEYEPIEDLREKADAPIETKTGINFSTYAPDAKYVSIVGDFNNWIDNRNPMKKNKYGVWSITIPLKKGRYRYKFNIDGVWVIDNENPEVEKDSFGDMKSVITVKKNTKFYVEPIYKGLKQAFAPAVTKTGVLFTYNDKFARTVTVGGTFNNWGKNQYYMRKNKNGIWSIIIQIPRGEYYYKYCVDGIWKEDPNGDNVEDGIGGYKSRLVINLDKEVLPSAPHIIDYEIVRFEYYNKELPSDTQISVIGNFNDWQENKNILIDYEFNKLWFTTVELMPGEYYYLFKIKNTEFIDPLNPLIKTNDNGKKVSYLYIEFPPGKYNVKFSYKNNKAKEVYLVGDFNNWNPEIDKMKKDKYGIWFITKKLIPDAYAYQFVVDNKWILDPSNRNTVVDYNGNYNSFIILGGNKWQKKD